VSKINAAYPKALTNNDLVKKVQATLSSYGYGKTSLVATSLCCDEVNRPLEQDLARAFGDHFSMGGLAGFPFAGLTGFGAMAHHIPDDGSCLVVYGPHVGVDSNGRVGTVDRRGRMKGGSCCGSAIAASIYVNGVMKGGVESPIPKEPSDLQQAFVGNMLLPYGAFLDSSIEPMADLPYALFEAQDDLIQKIVAKGAQHIHGKRGKVALLGGIQINTPTGVSDYFLPLKFELRNNKGQLVEDLLWDTTARRAAGVTSS
jgi:Limiting CO2-inducible proteins B/C beta carbonyic anhydrases